MKYDVILVGAGPSSIFCAYRLLERGLKILIIEKGKNIEHRICPKRKNGGSCINCNICSITSGFSGAGAFSDGKLTLASTGVGGNLDEMIGEEKVKKLIKEIDDIYLDFGAPMTVYGKYNGKCEKSEANKDIEQTTYNIRKKAIKANMKLIDSPVRHLGTDIAYEVYRKMQHYLINNGVEILFDTKVVDIIIDDKNVKGIITDRLESIFSDIVIVGAGREGASWFESICKKHSIETEPGTVDIGVRVECRNEVMEELNKLYESKLIYYSKTYSDKVRTFCQNPAGEVALENYELLDGSRIKTVNGHAYEGNSKKTDNTNFAILVSKNFTEPFKEPLEYGAAYAKIANMLAGGNVLVQTYGDIKRHRRSTQDRIKHGNVVPSLKDAVPGDLMSCIPARIMTDIIEMIEALDELAPGIANDETLLYGIEVKFYSNKVILKEGAETSINGLFSIGDSSSWTRGLSFASAMGIYTANHLLKNKFI